MPERCCKLGLSAAITDVYRGHLARVLDQTVGTGYKDVFRLQKMLWDERSPYKYWLRPDAASRHFCGNSGPK